MAIAKTEEIRGSGKRKILYGHLHTMDDGTRVYIARRKRRELFRSGRSSISGAMADEVAAWAIDDVLLVSLRAKGVRFVGVREEDTQDLYMTKIETWFDRKCFKIRDYTGVGRGGSRQRYVPLQHFAHTPGRVQIDPNSLF